MTSVEILAPTAARPSRLGYRAARGRANRVLNMAVIHRLRDSSLAALLLAIVACGSSGSTKDTGSDGSAPSALDGACSSTQACEGGGNVSSEAGPGDAGSAEAGPGACGDYRSTGWPCESLFGTVPGPSVVCCVQQQCVAGQSAIDALGCNSNNEQMIEAPSYDQSCRADSDCVAVEAGNFCLPVACSWAAINNRSLSQYQADVAKTNAAKCLLIMSCMYVAGPCCRSGVCQMGAACPGRDAGGVGDGGADAAGVDAASE
jgi:hypothetical protein